MYTDENDNNIDDGDDANNQLCLNAASLCLLSSDPQCGMYSLPHIVHKYN